MARNTGLYTSEMIKIAYDAFNECLKTTEASQPSDLKARVVFKIQLVQAILRAVAKGEREPAILKEIGLKSVAGDS